jgi:hypothetical protein
MGNLYRGIVNIPDCEGFASAEAVPIACKTEITRVLATCGRGAVTFHTSTDGGCSGGAVEDTPAAGYNVPPQGPGCHAYATWAPPLPEDWLTTAAYYQLTGCSSGGFAIAGGFLCNDDCSECAERYPDGLVCPSKTALRLY